MPPAGIVQIASAEPYHFHRPQNVHISEYKSQSIPMNLCWSIVYYPFSRFHFALKTRSALCDFASTAFSGLTWKSIRPKGDIVNSHSSTNICCALICKSEILGKTIQVQTLLQILVDWWKVDTEGRVFSKEWAVKHFAVKYGQWLCGWHVTKVLQIKKCNMSIYFVVY